MRPLRAASDDRPAPEGVKRVRRKTRPTPATPAPRPKTRRRKPPPSWLGPLLRWGGLALVVGAVGGGALWAWQSGRLAATRDAGAALAGQVTGALGLTVAEVLVDGRERTPRSELIAALDVDRGDAILAVDLAARRAAVERLGWVERARIARQLPDTIYLAIEERVPFARWQLERRITLIDPAGVPISRRVPDDLRDLPLVVGRRANREARRLFESLAAAPELMRRIESASLIRGRRWDIAIAGGVTVRLPESGLASAWRMLAELVARDRLLSRDLVAIDLRLPDRMIVRLAPGAQEARRRPAKDT